MTPSKTLPFWSENHVARCYSAPRMKRIIKQLARGIPALNQLVFVKGAVQGHFYSPIPSLQQIRRDRHVIFEAVPRQIPGVDLREEEQLKLLDRLAREFYPEQPFSEDFLQNDAFRYCDAIVLYCMLRYSRPRRVIEVGCGYSSRVTLETNKAFLADSVECLFIEPFPAKWLKATVGSAVIGKRIQDVPLETFSTLESGDILFIDSTHVSKVGSDVNHIFFRILPILRPGVRVHFHDVFYPFEYSENWILDGKAWNEDYLLRAFLQYNRDFQIELFPNYLMLFHRDVFEKNMPLCLKDSGGSIWIIRR